MTPVGLRIDVDTFRGTREGVPRLLETLSSHAVEATFFFTVGPDNMGRHLWRLFRPSFLAKMIRSRAPSLYGWDILLAGTCWPGRRIAASLGHVMRSADEQGHEVGLHAWDHHRWQTQLDRMSPEAIHEEIGRGFDALADALGKPPTCSATAGWRCNERVLRVKEAFGFRYNSDCRGHGVFRPRLGELVCTPQIPTTLPTYDELIGQDGVNARNYNTRLMELMQPEQLNVLTVHAEVEGIVCASMFRAFLADCRERGIELVPLGKLLDVQAQAPEDRITEAPLPGRAGTVCWQASSPSDQ
jgi:undecaprenyl phosphate-alpha-L-ara4FN deformylase